MQELNLREENGRIQQEAMLELIRSQQQVREYNRDEARERKNKHETTLPNAKNLMKEVLTKMPDVAEDLPSYFELAARIFDTNKVDNDLKVTVLTPDL